MKYNQFQKCKVCLDIVKQYDSIEPYIKLVKQVIKNAEGFPVLVEVDENETFATIRAWEYDFLGDVRVPLKALIF